MDSLGYLFRNRPEWVHVLHTCNMYIEVNVCTPKQSGKLGTQYQLQIIINSKDSVSVKEKLTEQQLPSCCSERHINYDGSFCLFLGSSSPIVSEGDAISWWKALGSFLNNQDFAKKFRQWPLEKGLSHGDAALVQIKMERLADEVNWRDELLMSWFRGEGWLSGELMKQNKNKDGFVNSRAPCVRGCNQLHSPNKKYCCTQQDCQIGCTKQHKPILRKKCPNKKVIENLTLLEYERRRLEDKYIKALSGTGIICCKTMNNCKLPG